MTVNREMSGLIATFGDPRQADHFVSELKRADFHDDQIGLLRPHRLAEDVEDDALAGAITGTMVGAVAGAFVTGLIPGVGPVIATGVLAGVLGGAAAGATAGGGLGALLALGFSEEKAHHHARALRRGRTLVVVQAEGRGWEALEILERCEGHLEPAEMAGS